MHQRPTPEDFKKFSASDWIKVVQERSISIQEMIGHFISIIDQKEKDIHAWVSSDYDKSLQQAEDMDRKIRKGETLGKLNGIPIGIKDTFNTSDFPTCMGSPLWEDFMPGNDARAVSSIKLSHGIIFGKTVTAEFGVHQPNKTVNPHNPLFSPGTSSSGSAAAVASGMVPLALGTQTAGSIIRPASYCGVYGFKPSFGLIPRTGTLKTTDSLDTIGFFGRSIEDLQLFLEELRVKGANFPISHEKLTNVVFQNNKAIPWRIGLVKGPKWNQAMNYAKEAFLNFAEELDSYQEIEIRDCELPEEFSSAHDIHETIYCKTLAYYFKEEFKQETLVSKVLISMVKKGLHFSLEDYKNAMRYQHELSKNFDNLFKSFDVLLNLSTAGEAPKHKESESREDSALIWTLCGAPVINIPKFKGPLDLPFGLQIVSQRYADYRALKFAKWMEKEGLIAKVVDSR